MKSSSQDRRPRGLGYAIVGITLLAPAFGGSTEVSAQATITVLVGLLLLAAPPQRSLGMLPNICLTGLILLAATAFLPASWFPLPPWRTDLLHLGAALPPTRSPQPWLTFQWSCFLLLALAWTYFVLTMQWPARLRERVSIIYALGILLLSLILIASFLTKHRVPFWPDVLEYGFFPNRNQTGDVLGIGGAMIYALGLQSFRENRKYWWLWPVSLCVVCSALIINYSRAGIILFFIGALVIHFYWWRTARDRQRPAVAIGGLVLLVILFAINGGATLMRFRRETAEFFSSAENLRWLILRDVLRLLPHWPIFGVGLGNFRPIFAISRFYSANIKEAAHPESDWLWSVVDLGWFAPILVLVLIFWWIKKCRPFDAGSLRLIRMGAVICGCAFVVHSVVDVSSHRLGALWPAVFLASIAIHPGAQFNHSRTVAVIFRILGFFFVAVGLWWSASELGFKRTPPTEATVEQLTTETEAANTRANYEQAILLANEGLAASPLNWVLYYERGLAEAATYRKRDEIQRDFAIASYLLPNWPDLPLNEGLVWLRAGEENAAFDLWEDALRRWPITAAVLYQRIFEVVRDNVEWRDRWRQLGHINSQCLPILLNNTNHLEFEVELERLLAEDPNLQSLSQAELKMVFDSWFRQGDQLTLADLLKRHPEWQPIAWEDLANSLANFGDYRQAYETARRFVEQPPLPKASSDTPIPSLLRQYEASGNIGDDGLVLVLAQIQAGELNGALANLESFGAMRKAPPSIYYLESEIWARKSEWAKAWQSLLKYEAALHK